MKLALLTKNRRSRRGSPRLTLFPLLAVLICAMGALVLLLLTVTRQARLQAEREATAKLTERQTDVKVEREAIQWRVEQLHKSRQTTESQLADARLVLGHLEDHARRLGTRLAQLRESAKNVEDVGTLAHRQRSSTEEEVRQAEAQVLDAERKLDEARKAVQKRPRSYAVVPYEGPNSTHRRPIYLECLADAIILQPEGIRFSETDFEGPLGPGNPLAAALRAARERMLAQGAIDPQNSGEPYPLLLVRPRGIGAYYAARAAMKSWASDFGYELIGDDWPLQFPPRDPGIAQVVQQAVDAARMEQRALIAAAPNKYARRGQRGAYRVTSGRGVAREGGADDDDDEGSPFHLSAPGPRYGNRYASSEQGESGSGGGGSGGSGGAAGGGRVDGGGGAVAGASGNGYGGASYRSSGMGGGNGTGAGNGTGSGSGSAAGADSLPYAAALASASGNARPGVAGLPGGSGAIGGASALPAMPGTAGGIPANAGMVPSPGSATGSPHGVPAGTSPPTGAVAGNPSPNAQGMPVQAGVKMEKPDGYVAGRPYEAQPDRRPPQPSDRLAAGVEPAAPLRPGEWRPSEEYAPPPKREEEKDKKHRKEVKSLAEKRGRDWGLRDASRGAVATTRPIHVDCFPDRLVLVPDDPRNAPKVVPFSGPTEGSMDKFIAAVWEYMESWGIAGKGMYWRPVLSVNVVPGAEQRFEELTLLLEGSGLTVRRR